MKITKIKKTNSKYQIVLENGVKIDTYDDVILSHHLLSVKELNTDLLNQINTENTYYDIYYKTVKYISKKLRSLKEVNLFLDKYEVNENSRKMIIDKLINIGLINDLAYAKAYINDRLFLSNDGPLKIKKSLLEHNIEESVIEELLEPLYGEFSKKLNKLISKKLKSNTKYGGYYLKQKITNEFSNLGYSYEMINDNYDSSLVSYDYDKEYEKLYKKLSKKYSGEMLERQIKQKLYQKGISKSE